MPTFRWFGALWVMSTPLIRMAPADGLSNPAIIRSVVVFPHPLGPRNDTNSPRSTASSKRSTAVW